MKRKSDPSQLSKMKCRFRTSTEREKLDTTATECSAKTDFSNSDKLLKRHLSSVHSENSFLKFLNEDRQKPTSLCDLTVSVSGKQYSVHKVVLAFGSSYFHARLCKNPETSHIMVDHVEDSAFQHLLGFLYTSEFVVSDTEIPFLVEAARSLNMVTAVDLLTDQSGSTTSSPVQIEGGPAEDLADTGLQSLPEGGAKAQASGAVSCIFCNRTFRYRKSLENHMARSHSTDSQGTQGEVAIETVAVVTTRRSARQRKTPAKFEECDKNGGAAEGKPKRKTLNGKGEEVDDGGGEEEEDEEGGNEEDNEQDTEEGNQRIEVVKGQKSTPAEEKVLEEVEEAREVNQEKQTSERKQVVESDSTATSQLDPCVAAGIPPSHEAAAHRRVSDSSSHTYPEGLAPLVIQTSNRKTLKCPKCDKTFDRIGRWLHPLLQILQSDLVLVCFL